MDIKEMTQSIQAAYPEFLMKQVVINEEGQNNTVLIANDEWVFRFPKHEKGMEALEKETAFLKVVQNKLPIPVPNSAYCNLETGMAFVGYQFLKGKPLRKQLFDSLDHKESVVSKLAVFMKTLHSLALTDELNSILGPPEKEKVIWGDLFFRLKEKVFVYMNERARQTVTAGFERFLCEIGDAQFRRTVIHGDFGPSNILYNPSTEKLSGVIDFGCVAIGDPALDLASAFFGPFGLGESWAQLVTEDYPETTMFIERARFYASTFALQEALFGIENGDEQAFQNGIAAYR